MISCALTHSFSYNYDFFRWCVCEGGGGGCMFRRRKRSITMLLYFQSFSYCYYANIRCSRQKHKKKKERKKEKTHSFVVFFFHRVQYVFSWCHIYMYVCIYGFSFSSMHHAPPFSKRGLIEETALFILMLVVCEHLILSRVLCLEMDRLRELENICMWCSSILGRCPNRWAVFTRISNFRYFIRTIF